MVRLYQDLAPLRLGQLVALLQLVALGQPVALGKHAVGHRQDLTWPGWDWGCAVLVCLLSASLLPGLLAFPALCSVGPLVLFSQQLVL